jgi:hypothetical protein
MEKVRNKIFMKRKKKYGKADKKRYKAIEIQAKKREEVGRNTDRCNETIK